jgi:hypothetical protein
MKTRKMWRDEKRDNKENILVEDKGERKERRWKEKRNIEGNRTDEEEKRRR